MSHDDLPLFINLFPLALDLLSRHSIRKFAAKKNKKDLAQCDLACQIFQYKRRDVY
jgi:hypothetical protein